jgi:hypothetical protein
LFPGQFRYWLGSGPTSYTVWGRFHHKEDRYHETTIEIIPVQARRGTRTYIRMQPYLLEPQQTLSIALTDQPTDPPRPGQPIGIVTGAPQLEGLNEVPMGTAFAYYYPVETTMLIWECFLDRRFRTDPLAQDHAMHQLWQAFEAYLLEVVSPVTLLTTPHRDLIASDEDYQAFLAARGYTPLNKRGWGKRLDEARLLSL